MPARVDIGAEHRADGLHDSRETRHGSDESGRRATPPGYQLYCRPPDVCHLALPVFF